MPDWPQNICFDSLETSKIAPCISSEEEMAGATSSSATTSSDDDGSEDDVVGKNKMKELWKKEFHLASYSESFDYKTASLHEWQTKTGRKTRTTTTMFTKSIDAAHSNNNNKHDTQNNIVITNNDNIFMRGSVCPSVYRPVYLFYFPIYPPLEHLKPCLFSMDPTVGQTRVDIYFFL